MDTTLVIAVVSLLTAVAAGAFNFVQGKAAVASSERIQRTKVDAEAYERAKEFTDSLIKSMRGEIDRLNDQVAALHAALDASEETNAVLQGQHREMTRTIAALKRRTIELQDRLSPGYETPGNGTPSV